MPYPKDYVKKWTPERAKEYARAWHKARMESGKCSDCARPAVKGKWRCQYHSDYRTLDSAIRNAGRRAALYTNHLADLVAAFERLIARGP